MQVQVDIGFDQRNAPPVPFYNEIHLCYVPVSNPTNPINPSSDKLIKEQMSFTTVVQKLNQRTLQGMGCYHSLLPFFVTFLGMQKSKTLANKKDEKLIES